MARRQITVMSSADLRGGLDPDPLDEVAYWDDDYWRYVLFAAIALIRASAAKTRGSVADLATRVAALHDVDLGGASTRQETAGSWIGHQATP
jgi:hypothetical protein